MSKPSRKARIFDKYQRQARAFSYNTAEVKVKTIGRNGDVTICGLDPSFPFLAPPKHNTIADVYNIIDP